MVRRRRMVRRYDGRPVDPEVLERALRNAVRAPSAGFSQGWAFLVLDAPDDVRRFWEASTSPEQLAEPDSWLRGMLTAPVVVVPCSSKAAYLDRYAQPDKGWTDRDEARWPKPFWDMDAAMASLLILLTAVDEGLGGCFFGESMFSLTDDASKVATVALAARLQEWEFDLIDGQLQNDHLDRFGFLLLPRAEFMLRLHKALRRPTRRGPWT